MDPLKSKSLTVVIPAFNEQENLGRALDNVALALQGLVDDYEIIVIDDGSIDRTPSIAREKMRDDPRVKCLSNDRNRGYGYSYWRGVMAATKDYVGVFTADNDMSWESLRDLVQNMGQADVLTSYMCNTHQREFGRRALSKAFVVMMNAVFQMRLKYFNGPFIGRRDLLQTLTIRSSGLTVLAECKVKLIKQGYSYQEIPFTYVRRSGGRSTALRLKSIKAVISAVGGMYKDIYLK
jgi:glycosyltransferase involved in cell wall biosynthesis